MTTPSEVIAQIITRTANDQRRTVATYGNVTARPGSSIVPRRLMNDIGFLQNAQFTYVNAHQTNYSIDDTEGQRKITKLVLVPTGLDLDFRRITTSSARERVIGSAGLKPYPGSDSLLMPGYLDSITHSDVKSQVLMRGMTTRQGPAYHYYIDRLGGITVGPTIDAVVASSLEGKDESVFIAIESALVISRTDHAQRIFNKLITLPLTELQQITLAILVDKLRVAIPAVPLEYATSTLPGVQQLVFSDGAWKNSDVPFSYASTDRPAFNEFVANQGNFDLATEVWRPASAAAPVASRSEARTAISQVNTMGAVAPLLGAYATIAASERSTAMQVLSRRQLFVARQRTANMDADNAVASASTVTESGDAMVDLATPPARFEVNTYDFVTGMWGDGKVY